MTSSLPNNLATTRASNGSAVDCLTPTDIDRGRKHPMTPLEPRAERHRVK